MTDLQNTGRIDWYRQTYSCFFLCYAELQFLTLLTDNLFGYEWIIYNWITGISFRLCNKNSRSFSWLFKECDYVKTQSEYRKYFRCSVQVIPSYSTHRLVAESAEVILTNTSVTKHVCYWLVKILWNLRLYTNMKRLLHWRFSFCYNIKYMYY